MDQTTRRAAVLGASFVFIGASGLPSCSTTSPPQLTPPVIDAIQAAVSKACPFVPSVATLLALLSVFPQLTGATSIASSVLSEIAGMLCKSFVEGGGMQGALGKKPFSAVKDNNTVPVHGLVFDQATGKFVEF